MFILINGIVVTDVIYGGWKGEKSVGHKDGDRNLEMKMVSERVEELEKMVSLLKRDAEKCDRGNASASTRVRKDLMNLIKEIKELRHFVLEQRKEKL